MGYPLRADSLKTVIRRLCKSLPELMTALPIDEVADKRSASTSTKPSKELGLQSQDEDDRASNPSNLIDAETGEILTKRWDYAQRRYQLSISGICIKNRAHAKGD